MLAARFQHTSPVGEEMFVEKGIEGAGEGVGLEEGRGGLEGTE